MGGLGHLLNNPDMANMASQMMNDPNIQNMMSQMMGAFGPGGAGGAQPGGLDSLMRVGEQIAETMQRSNPELVENLRRQFEQNRGPSDNPDGQQDPNNGQQQ